MPAIKPTTRRPPPRTPRPRLWADIPRTKLEEILSANLARRWRARWPRRIYLGDDEYYVPPRTEVIALIRESRPLFARWTAEVFDCDDFAFVLKAHFCRAAISEGRRRFAYCFGIVWKNKPTPHAMNWVVYRAYNPRTRGGGRLVFRLVEPQWFANPKLRPLRPIAPDDGDFYFVTA